MSKKSFLDSPEAIEAARKIVLQSARDAVQWRLILDGKIKVQKAKPSSQEWKGRYPLR